MVGRKPDIAFIVLHRLIDDIAAQSGGTGISGEMGKDTGGRVIAPDPFEITAGVKPDIVLVIDVQAARKLVVSEDRT